MKRFLEKNHNKIDLISISVFLYSLCILVFLELFTFINNESIYILTVLVMPLIIVNKKNIYYINELLHSIFGFRR